MPDSGRDRGGSKEERSSTEELDQQHPIDSLLAVKNQRLITSGKVSGLVWAKYLQIGDGSVEAFVGRIITEAVRAKRWVSIEIELEDGILPQINENHGIGLMVKNGWLELHGAKGRYVVTPTRELIDIVADRLKNLGPQEGDREV